MGERTGSSPTVGTEWCLPCTLSMLSLQSCCGSGIGLWMAPGYHVHGTVCLNSQQLPCGRSGRIRMAMGGYRGPRASVDRCNVDYFIYLLFLKQGWDITPYPQWHRPQHPGGPADRSQTHTPPTTAHPAQTPIMLLQGARAVVRARDRTHRDAERLQGPPHDTTSPQYLMNQPQGDIVHS